MFHKLSNHFSKLFIIVKEIVINNHFLYINHHIKSNVVYFIIYLINYQHNCIIWHLKFIIVRALNERKTRFIFSFFRFSVVSKQSIHIFHVYFINAFNYDFYIKFFHDSYFLLSTLVMHTIVIKFLIVLIIFSCAVDNVLDLRRCIFSYNKELNST